MDVAESTNKHVMRSEDGLITEEKKSSEPLMSEVSHSMEVESKSIVVATVTTHDERTSDAAPSAVVGLPNAFATPRVPILADGVIAENTASLTLHDITVCVICKKGDVEDKRALKCSHCRSRYHVQCFREKISKLINTTSEKWYCPTCSTLPAIIQLKKECDATPSKAKKSTRKVTVKTTRSPKKEKKDKVISVGSAKKKTVVKKIKGATTATAVTGPKKKVVKDLTMDEKFTQVVDAALRAGKTFNLLVMERTEAMMELTQNLLAEMSRHHQTTSSTRSQSQPEVSLQINNSKDDGSQHHLTSSPVLTATVLPPFISSLATLNDLLISLQCASVQAEVDLITEVKIPAMQSSATSNCFHMRKAHSRLYTKQQQTKLEEWYQLSSRPENLEINAMFCVINGEPYCDQSVQPQGISLKQIRIWFDNRRAKERLDYMKAKVTDAQLKGLTPVEAKQLKTTVLLEAKEVLEARVTRLRENSSGAQLIIDEGASMGGPVAAASLKKTTTSTSLTPMKPTMKPTANSRNSSSGRPSVRAGAASGVVSKLAASASLIGKKRKLQWDQLSSVMKATQEAREAGQTEEAIASIQTVAMEAAKGRLALPGVSFVSFTGGDDTANEMEGTRGGQVTMEDLTHLKTMLIHMTESKVAAEEVSDVIALLRSMSIPKNVLIMTNITRQLKLTVKAYKEVKWVVKEAKMLLDTFNIILRTEDEEPVKGSGITVARSSSMTSATISSSGAPPVASSVSCDSSSSHLLSDPMATTSLQSKKRIRVKFSLDQLKNLEKNFLLNAQPSKSMLDKIVNKLNSAPLCPSDGSVAAISTKQVRCWYYKRRASNTPPQALLDHPEGGILTTGGITASFGASDSGSSTESEIEDVSVSPDKNTMSMSSSHASLTPSLVSSRATTTTTTTPRRTTLTGESRSKRIFSSQQVELIVREYDLSCRPVSEKMDALCSLLNSPEYEDLDLSPAGVTRKQVMTWFSNRRAKERSDFVKAKIIEAKAAGLTLESDIAKVREVADHEIKEMMSAGGNRAGDVCPVTSSRVASSPVEDGPSLAFEQLTTEQGNDDGGGVTVSSDSDVDESSSDGDRE